MGRLRLQGWTYAIDFPATYTKDKKWNSCVRRKRWLRYRRYKVMDSWAKVRACCVFMCVCNALRLFTCVSLFPCVASQIPSQQAALPDPFSDISCGGWEISDEPRGRMSLWAVSLQGKVHTHTHMQRTHLSFRCPWQCARVFISFICDIYHRITP